MTTNASANSDELPTLGILAELDPKLRRLLASHGRFETLDPGTYLIKQNDDHHALSVIIQGNLLVSCHAHGDYVDLATLGPGHTVGEMSVIDPQKSSADVKVGEYPVRLWTIEGGEFNDMIDSDLEIGAAIMKILAKEMCRRLRQNSDHMLNQADTLRTHFLDIDY